MRTLSHVGIALAAFAAVLWAYVALDGAWSDGWPGESAPSAAAAELAPYPGAEDIVARRVWTGGNPLQGSTPSPDGRYLTLYTGGLDLADLQTGAVRELVPAPDWSSLPAVFFMAGHSGFSPDGSRIALEWFPLSGSDQSPPDTSAYVRLLDLEGRDVGSVYPPAFGSGDAPSSIGSAQLLAWMPDGERVLLGWQERFGPLHMRVVRVEDEVLEGDRTLEVMTRRQGARVAVSPDGAWIAYARPREGDAVADDIALVSLDGSGETLIESEEIGRKEVVGWLPGGGPLFYLSETQGGTRLLAQDLEGPEALGPPRVVRSDMMNMRTLGAFDDGFFFLLEVEPTRTVLSAVDLEQGVLTAPLIPINTDPTMGGSVRAAWSGDGELLAYVEGVTTAPSSIVLRSTRSGAERRITPEGLRDFRGLALNHDGSEIVAVASSPGRYPGGLGLYRIRTATSQWERLDPGGAQWGFRHPPNLVWAPDGETVYFKLMQRSGGDVQAELLAYDLASGVASPVLPDVEYNAGSISPDGREVAVVRRLAEIDGERLPSVLWSLSIVDLDTGAERELIEPEEGLIGSRTLTWSPDGRHILYSKSWPAVTRSEWRTELRVISRDGGEPRTIRDGVVGSARLHPDGVRLVMDVGPSGPGSGDGFEVWTVENLREVVGLR